MCEALPGELGVEAGGMSTKGRVPGIENFFSAQFVKYFAGFSIVFHPATLSEMRHDADFAQFLLGKLSYILAILIKLNA